MAIRRRPLTQGRAPLHAGGLFLFTAKTPLIPLRFPTNDQERRLAANKLANELKQAAGLLFVGGSILPAVGLLNVAMSIWPATKHLFNWRYEPRSAHPWYDQTRPDANNFFSLGGPAPVLATHPNHYRYVMIDQVMRNGFSEIKVALKQEIFQYLEHLTVHHQGRYYPVGLENRTDNNPPTAAELHSLNRDGHFVGPLLDRFRTSINAPHGGGVDTNFIFSQWSTRDGFLDWLNDPHRTLVQVTSIFKRVLLFVYFPLDLIGHTTEANIFRYAGDNLEEIVHRGRLTIDSFQPAANNELDFTRLAIFNSILVEHQPNVRRVLNEFISTGRFTWQHELCHRVRTS